MFYNLESPFGSAGLVIVWANSPAIGNCETGLLVLHIPHIDLCFDMLICLAVVVQLL